LGGAVQRPVWAIFCFHFSLDVVKKCRQALLFGIKKALKSLRFQGFLLAAGEGFEPSQTESESGVLPLHKPATRKEYYTEFRKFVKHKFPPGENGS
jgi:hypothetical protein